LQSGLNLPNLDGEVKTINGLVAYAGFLDLKMSESLKKELDLIDKSAVINPKK
jgi:hypothetical protein